MGSDGASNMVGKISGVAARLKKDCPEVISVHCLNHRLELGFRDCFKSGTVKTQYDKMMSLLVWLHYFYL